MVMSTLCGENLLENRVMVYFPGASPTVLKSNSFSPFLLSQWNLFASSLSWSGGKTTLPVMGSTVESEKRAVLSRIPVLHVLLVNRRSTSISCPTWNGVVCRDKEQNESPFSTNCLSRAVTAERPGSVPSMVGSPQPNAPQIVEVE